MSRIVWAAVAAVLLAAPALAKPVVPLEPVSGPARVIDGDTLEIAGKRIRLHGVDTPEKAQLCELDGASYDCGRRVTKALVERLGARTVTCLPRDVDRYGRLVAACRVGGRDVGRWLVSQGWAVAYAQYSKDYVPDEAAARAARRGLWAGSFMRPDEWRRARRAASRAARGAR